MNRLASRLVPIATAAVALASAGCFQAKSVVAVANDGSGSYKETTSLELPPEEHQPGRKPADDALANARKQLAAIPGIEVKTLTSEVTGGKLTVHVEATFKTLEGYARATRLEANAELAKSSDGSYTLTFETDNLFAEKTPEPGAKPEKEDAAAAAAIAKIELSRTLKLPGTILATNGTKSEDGSSVTWTMSGEDLKKAGKKLSQSVTFKGDGLDLKPFKLEHKVEAMGDAPPK